MSATPEQARAAMTERAAVEKLEQVLRDARLDARITRDTTEAEELIELAGAVEYALAAVAQRMALIVARDALIDAWSACGGEPITREDIRCIAQALAGALDAIARAGGGSA